MTNFIRASLLAVGMTALASGSFAQVIDFEDLNNNGAGGFTLYGDNVNSGGFNFASVLHAGDPAAIASWTADIGGPYTGSVAIFANYFDDSLNMTQIGGGIFSVTSIDMADVFLGSTSDFITFTGTHADFTTTIEVVQLTDGSALQTYNLSTMNNLISLNINDNPSNDLQIDNINVSTVPEPGTFIAIGVGLAALALRRRR